MKLKYFLLFIATLILILFFGCSKNNHEDVNESDSTKINEISKIIFGKTDSLKWSNFFFTHPKFSLNDSSIFFASQMNRKPYRYSVNTEKLTELSNSEVSAGKFFIVDEQNLVFYSINRDESKRVESYKIIKLDLESLEEKTLFRSTDRITDFDFHKAEHVISIVHRDSLVIIPFSEKSKQKIIKYTIDRNTIVARTINSESRLKIFEDDYVTQIQQLDENRFVVTGAKTGTFFYYANSDSLFKIGDYSAFAISENCNLIAGLRHTDDGLKTQNTEIEIKSLNSIQTVLYSIKSERALENFSWSHNGEKLICNSSDGEIIIYNFTYFY
ncbi:MAG: hypothetical protein KKD86_02185 [Bacteroidetes bacterium]|nr:hypothetical protein [Bacteroidota bacterium]MBU1677657.1 hypothetical protein [Bacteroidota bacterium]